MSKQRNPNGHGTFIKRSDGRVAWRQIVDGQTREISAKTLKELKEKIKGIASLPILKDKHKVSEWFEKWLEVYIKPLKKQATYDQYNFIYKSHILPAMGSKKISTIKSIDIQNVIAEMNKKNLSTWTMKHARKVMSGAFGKAVKEKIIALNPVMDIEIPIKQAKPRKVLRPDELSKIFEAMKDSRWIWSIRFDLLTGLRRGELLALKWSDIDFVNRTITINKSNSESGLGDTKNSKIHQIPLSDSAIFYLNQQKAQLQNEFNPILYNDKLKKSNLVFPSDNGTLLKPRSYYTMLCRFAEKVNKDLPEDQHIHATPHCLRHTFVYMMRNTLSLKQLQDILGHDERTTTTDMYGDMIDDKPTETAKKIEEAFSILETEMKKTKEKKDGKVIEFRSRKAK